MGCQAYLNRLEDSAVWTTFTGYANSRFFILLSLTNRETKVLKLLSQDSRFLRLLVLSLEAGFLGGLNAGIAQMERVFAKEWRSADDGHNSGSSEGCTAVGAVAIFELKFN